MAALAQMVPDHFCILKVGPWLTFAYREALFGLVEIEKELYEDKPGWQSFLRQRLEKVMVENPKYWENHYTGSGREKKFKRKFSYLDHGGSIELVQKCLDEGFDSVMIDASEQSLVDNIAVTKATVKIAEPYHATVESGFSSNIRNRP
jgi:tagatose-1,6-bisphosphate aldolase non-catalytic subunit AgaZ/GatZ